MSMGGIGPSPQHMFANLPPEVLDVVCSICEEHWASSRLEEHSELCVVLRAVRGGHQGGGEGGQPACAGKQAGVAASMANHAASLFAVSRASCVWCCAWCVGVTREGSWGRIGVQHVSGRAHDHFSTPTHAQTQT